MTEERLNELIWEVVSKQVHTNTEVMQEIARELSVYFASNSSSIDANSINYQLIEETLKKRQNEILSNISHLTWSVSIASYEDTKDLYKADLLSFDSKIGYITNCSTTLYSMLPLYEKGTKEYDTIMHRLKECRVLQGNEID